MGFDLTNTGAGVQNKTQDFGETIFGFSYTNVFGMKMTNVFGLAWNYYVGYTKVITGLDLTLDADWKIEIFYAKCFKLGSATEYKMNSIESGKIENSFFKFLQKETKAAATTEAAIGSRTAVVEEENVAAESRLVLIGQDVEERADLISVTTGAESRTTSALMWFADDFGFQATATFNVNSPAVYLNGALVEIG